jgi:hypothetical protein
MHGKSKLKAASPVVQRKNRLVSPTAIGASEFATLGNLRYVFSSRASIVVFFSLENARSDVSEPNDHSTKAHEASNSAHEKTKGPKKL